MVKSRAKETHDRGIRWQSYEVLAAEFMRTNRSTDFTFTPRETVEKWRVSYRFDTKKCSRNFAWSAESRAPSHHVIAVTPNYSRSRVACRVYHASNCSKNRQKTSHFQKKRGLVTRSIGLVCGPSWVHLAAGFQCESCDTLQYNRETKIMGSTPLIRPE